MSQPMNKPNVACHHPTRAKVAGAVAKLARDFSGTSLFYIGSIRSWEHYESDLCVHLFEF